MSKYITFVGLALGCNTILGQNCPTGYEERLVKCKGQLIKKCLPVDYECKQCWKVEYAPCPGKTLKGNSSHSSYEKALESAKREPSSWSDGQCYFYDNKNFKIYLDDCGEGGNNLRSMPVDDLRNRIKPFLQRHLALIQNYRRELQGKPPKPGATLKEYQSNLKLSEEYAEKLQTYLDNLNNNNLKTVEYYFEQVKEQEATLKQSYNNYINSTQKQPNNPQPVLVICPSCDGKRVLSCNNCQGSGKVEAKKKGYGTHSADTDSCEKCLGTGTNTCTSCNGTGTKKPKQDAESKARKAN